MGFNTPCIHPGCTSKSRTLKPGYCTLHYQSLKKRGLIRFVRDIPFREIIMDRVEIEPYSGCWIWTAGYFGKNGYGQWRIGSVKANAHRAVYHHLVGPIPEGMHVCHKCDSPFCVNPRHMFLGTRVENMQDAAEKGRLSMNCSKLSTGDVLEIRNRALFGNELQKEIARDFGIKQNNVSRIKLGRRFRRVRA